MILAGSIGRQKSKEFLEFGYGSLGLEVASQPLSLEVKFDRVRLGRLRVWRFIDRENQLLPGLASVINTKPHQFFQISLPLLHLL